VVAILAPVRSRAEIRNPVIANRVSFFPPDSLVMKGGTMLRLSRATFGVWLAGAVALTCGFALLGGDLLAQEKKVVVDSTFMEENVSPLNKEFIKAARDANNFATNADNLAKSADKLTSVMKLVAANPPEKVAKDKKKYVEFAELQQKNAVSLGKAAKAKDHAAFVAAYRQLDSTCAKCHELLE
jgi:hypothetical protein